MKQKKRKYQLGQAREPATIDAIRKSNKTGMRFHRSLK
jgi:hypothetical protein